jgi:large subunit ribosomal protein L35
MPKMKTNKSASKRFKVTPTGKVMYVHSGKRHNLESMSPKRKRNASTPDVLDPTNTKHVLRLLGKR